eukprot:TRINITY_DN90841_c0_g1_i1.p1 TRINITY_DN90841_c0_g1~~TRINITY_DN90841_c0_g1_i1.p1  ORF type:complete len:346 (-),score=62.10 TRINITY_DN90841_c0_g1_i1:177-1130(-)
MKLQVNIKAAKGLAGEAPNPCCTCTEGAIPSAPRSADGLTTGSAEDAVNPAWEFSGAMEWAEEKDLIFCVWDGNDVRLGDVRLEKGKVAGFVGTLPLSTNGTIEIAVQEVTSSAPALASSKTATGAPQSHHITTDTDLWKLLQQNETLMWKRPQRSGLVLGALDLGFLLLFFGPSPLSMLSKLGCVCICLGAALRILGVKVSDECRPKISEQSVQVATETVAVALGKTAAFTQYIVSWQSSSATCKVIAALYILGGASYWLSVHCIVFVLLNLTFILPVNATVIEQTIQPHWEKLNDLNAKVHAMVPKYADVASKED